MFRTVATRSVSFARQLAVPKQTKCIGKLTEIFKLFSYPFVLLNVVSLCSSQPAYVSCRSTRPSPMLSLMLVTKPFSTVKTLMAGSAAR